MSLRVVETRVGRAEAVLDLLDTRRDLRGIEAHTTINNIQYYIYVNKYRLSVCIPLHSKEASSTA